MSLPVCTICTRTFSGRWNNKKYDRLQFFQRHMESIFDKTHVDYKVIVIDDASTCNKQKAYLKELSLTPRVEVIIKPRNLGRQHSFTMQRKLGLISGSPYVCICDDDYVYRDGWLGRMIEGYEVLKKDYPNIGLLSGFHREGFVPAEIIERPGFKFGAASKWLGCRWLMAREVIIKGEYLELAPEPGWPNNAAQKKWTSPWIDDGSYQMQLTKRHGYHHAFTIMDTPSLVEHTGTFGVHSRPNKHVWGAK